MFGVSILPGLRKLAANAIFFGYNLIFSVFIKWWYRVKYAIKKRNYPVVVFMIVFPVVTLAGAWFTGLIDYVINISLSFVFFFFNLAYFIVHTLAYIILYIPLAIFDYGLKFIAGVWDYGIIDKLPVAWLSDKLPSASDYVSALNLIPLLNAFFYGSVVANTTAPGNAAILADPPTVGDFFWRPVTVDLNNPVGDRVNPVPGVTADPTPAMILDGGGYSGGGSSDGGGDLIDLWDLMNSPLYPPVDYTEVDPPAGSTSWDWDGDNIPDTIDATPWGDSGPNYNDNSGGSSWDFGGGGTDLHSVHNTIDNLIDGDTSDDDSENYNPVSDGGTSWDLYGGDSNPFSDWMNNLGYF